MAAPAVSEADDALLAEVPHDVENAADRRAWFDRFYFNLHAPDDGPFLVVGAGLSPGADLVDGYVCAIAGNEQRNLRLSHQPFDPASLGPLSWETIEPLRRWRLTLAANPSAVAFDVVWTARTAPWAVAPIRVGGADEHGQRTDFSHFFQSGRYEGSIAIDGVTTIVDGCVGQRDRSRGLRRSRDRLGMHLWVAAQMPDHCIAANFNIDREGDPTHCDGAVLGEDGSTRRITDLRHRLQLDATDELQAGALIVELEDGAEIELAFTALGPGLYMAGAGYGGWHGVPRGPDHVEHERWPLDGTQNPRTLALGLVDKPCRFTVDGSTGDGLMELAVSRSSSFHYRATIP